MVSQCHSHNEQLIYFTHFNRFFFFFKPFFCRKLDVQVFQFSKQLKSKLKIKFSPMAIL